MALELASDGITVNCVSPGATNTPRRALAAAQFPDREKALNSTVLLDRLGQPEEIANMKVFLASDEAAYITSQDYSVDGGVVRT